MSFSEFNVWNLFKGVGILVIAGAAFFSPTPEKVAVFVGLAAVAAGQFGPGFLKK